MDTHKVKRKLAAILSADMKGYSRLMSEDEVEIIRILDTYKEIMGNFVQKLDAKVVDSSGTICWPSPPAS